MPVIDHRRPSRGSIVLWVLVRILVKPVLSIWPLSPLGLRAARVLEPIARRVLHPAGVVTETIDVAGRRTEYTVAARPSRRAGDTAILYLHGGGFVAGGPCTHRTVTAGLARTTELPVFAPDYRLIPDGGVGTSVHDAVAAYRELVTERGFRYVVVAGDSAGGFLCGKIVEAAAETGLPSPPAFVGYSPMLDLDLAANPDSGSRSDAYLPKRRIAQLAPRFDDGPIPLRGVRRITELAPQLMPPTLVVSAKDEFFEIEMVRLVEGLDAAGGTAVLHRFAWQVHAFPTMSGAHRETVETIALTAEFVADALSLARADEQARKTG
ncbi:alpha/beta hydrolase [Williamsia sp. CHRR-6]|uniref:alpha/beta hydrolase n=1 Tax=Williamsia sp. CHRR-6 TaxID=2835871 RepID=UPI001BDAC865|nr:alpha/beta hydrolase [Williamsia sp. CHRR-6]MBT0567103.1 alpha/beta hydrolase [Williamsia sp. CHRR-6]